MEKIIEKIVKETITVEKMNIPKMTLESFLEKKGYVKKILSVTKRPIR